MSVWAQVRRQARDKHRELSRHTPGLVSAEALFREAEETTGISRHAVSASDAILDGAEAVYDRDGKRIYYSREVDPLLAAFYVGHEFAHHWLDQHLARCQRADIDVTTPAEPNMSWVGDPDAYSPKERAEALANVFAREFLLPRDKLREHCLGKSFSADAIAAVVGVPVDLVMQQLADALLLPEEPEGAGRPEPEAEPDDTQRRAIEAGLGPLRVQAGPGTGKTRTLIGRVAWLIDNGAHPGSIVVLTFSNLSALDLSARLRAALGDRATAIWVGTFHAFGLELLRKYGSAIGLPANLRLLDRSGSLDLLQDLLPALDLVHYLDLHEPLRRLGSVLALISRAKDELASPALYHEKAVALRQRAFDDKTKEEGDKAIEVARAYAAYDSALRQRGLVDFGDLIARSVELLRHHPEIATRVRAERAHVLVDEYQDMNRASGHFLQALVTAGAGPWVVGDVRQAIYRFRGASPINLENFPEDFPGAKTLNLGINYRSGGKIVGTFEAFLGQRTLTARRGEALGRVDYHVASTAQAEFEGIAQDILAAVRGGGVFRDHAVLARSHTTLGRLARHLERRGVPSLYFGDFFEREEIRDLLALVQLVGEPGGIGLVRVAGFPRYGISGADVAGVFQHAKDADVPVLKALQAHGIAAVSESGRAAFARLASDVGTPEYADGAHRFLLGYLFKSDAHLGPLLADGSVAGQQKRLAIYQLLQFASSFRPPSGGNPKAGFLDHVRRLELLDEEKGLRQLPAAALDIDAVRLMTVHAAKGLQFPVVRVPALTSAHFPYTGAERDQLPPGLADTSALMSREAEEGSLFFVAMSRAKDMLSLSRAINNGGGRYKNLKASSFLERIRNHLPRPPDAPASWTVEGPSAPVLEVDAPLAPRTVWSVHAIETYLDCPLRFYYNDVLKLGGRDARSPYLQTHGALHATIEAFRHHPRGEPRDRLAVEHLDAEWERSGPRGHPLEPLYRNVTSQLLQRALEVVEGESLESNLSAAVAGGVHVTSRADHISVVNGVVRVQRLKLGRLSKTETDKARYTIQQVAARIAHPGRAVEFEHVSLLTGERRDAALDAGKIEKRLVGIAEAVAGIEAGQFLPKPGQFCPQCPYYFVCPSHFRVE